MTSPKPKRIKLTIVGDGSTGKTCLLMVFKDEEFPSDYVPTVFENYVKYLTYDSKPIELVLWDTAGQEDYDSIRPLSYPDTDVILLCYSMDIRESFDNIETKWHTELKWYCPKVPVILVGLKKDLRSEAARHSDIENANETDFVSFEEGKKMAEKIGAADFLECSSLKGEGVNEVFESAIKNTLNGRKKMSYRLRKYICFIPA
ncbi:ras-like GTP-binding protein Rho1 [Dendronephthya gigantea]|uniref:ras-like GTP-binding protein Rho1 n=1 Tax=Dendronephthya gigantea TaxID=151771 RepID=UPI0010698DC9|nr:ras-like GTP-binding protein Rho1 [Dendronephthya gigantea]